MLPTLSTISWLPPLSAIQAGWQHILWSLDVYICYTLSEQFNFHFICQALTFFVLLINLKCAAAAHRIFNRFFFSLLLAHLFLHFIQLRCFTSRFSPFNHSGWVRVMVRRKKRWNNKSGCEYCEMEMSSHYSCWSSSCSLLLETKMKLEARMLQNINSIHRAELIMMLEAEVEVFFSFSLYNCLNSERLSRTNEKFRSWRIEIMWAWEIFLAKCHVNSSNTWFIPMKLDWMWRFFFLPSSSLHLK